MATTATLSDIYRGDTKTYKMTFQDSSKKPIPLFGSSIWFTMKKREDDADSRAVIQVKTSPEDTTDSTNGIAYITLTSEDTDVAVGEYYYDFQLVVPGTPPIVTTLTTGSMSIVTDITRNIA